MGKSPGFQNSVADHSLVARIDAVCDEFEAGWKREQPPSIEAYLEEWGAAHREDLLHALLEVEFEYRSRSEATIQLKEYEQRFPQYSNVVGDVFAKRLPDTLLIKGGEEPTSTEIGTRSQTKDEPRANVAGYELLHELGRGGMGVVYKARQVRLNRLVALKMIRSGELAGTEEIQRFHSEAEAAAQLDHPGIVPVFEVGEDNGQCFFSMGLVAGEGLDTRLKDGPLAPRDAAELMCSIARAVQYAHEQKIVHRDLKPANVLMDADGNPRITDFGLAKRVDADSGMTATGQVMGTPSYMPPEQAAGRIEKIGPQSDVYSLGAILYAVLTGRPPFQAANVLETLEQVRHREPVSPRQLNPAVDKDLETICLKCLDKEISRRYSSARAFEEDLTRYLEGRPIIARPVGRSVRVVRWCRRNPLGAGIIVLLLILAIGGPTMAIVQSNLRRRANEATDRADAEATKAKEALAKERRTNRDLESTVHQWVAATKNSRLLKDPRFKQELKEFLQQARRHYEGFIRDHIDDSDPQTQAKVVQALVDMGYINSQSGSKPEAVATYLQLKQFLRKRTIDGERISRGDREKIVLCCNNLGSLYQSLGDTAKSQREYDEALRLISEMAAEEPANLKYQDDLALAHHNLGTLHRVRGNSGKALSEYRQALRIREKLLKAAPDSVMSRRQLASLLMHLADLFAAYSRAEEAVPVYQRTLAIQKKLAREDPSNHEIANELALTFNNFGILYDDLGKSDESMKTYRAALALRIALVREQPTVTMYHRELAGVHHNIALLQSHKKELVKALASHRKALTIREKLAADNPGVTQFQEDLASSYSHIAAFFSRQGDAKQAVEGYRRALPIRKKLVQDHPAFFDYQLSLADTYSGLAYALKKLQRVTEADAASREALRIRKELAEKHADSSAAQSNLAASYYSNAERHRRSSRFDEAIEAHLAALTIREKLHRQNPRLTEPRNDIATSHSALGMIYRKRDRLSDAHAAHQKAVRFRKQLAEENPSIDSYRHNLAFSHYRVGLVQRDRRRYQQAIAGFQNALKLYAALETKDPQQLDYQYHVARCWDNIGICQLKLRDVNRALNSTQAATRYFQRLANQNRTIESYQKHYARVLYNLSVIHRRRGDSQGALEASERALKVQQQLVLQNPNEEKYKSGLATRLFGLGVMLHRSRSPQRARNAYVSSIRIFKGLLAEDPNVEEYRDKLRKCYNNLGDLLNRIGKPELSAGAHRSALDILASLAGEFPKNKEYRKAHLTALYILAVRLYEIGDAEPIIKHLDVAIPLLESAWKSSPRDTTTTARIRSAYYMRALAFDALDKFAAAAADWKTAIRYDDGTNTASLKRRLALSLVRTGKHAEAIALVADQRKSTTRGSSLMRLARAHSLAAGQAAVDSSLTPENRSELQSRYASQAVALLRRAAAVGYFRLERRKRYLVEHPDLEAVRGRADLLRLAESLGVRLPVRAPRPRSGSRR